VTPLLSVCLTVMLVDQNENVDQDETVSTEIIEMPNESLFIN
jgi:hypothetical protein